MINVLTSAQNLFSHILCCWSINLNLQMFTQNTRAISPTTELLLFVTKVCKLARTFNRMLAFWHWMPTLYFHNQIYPLLFLKKITYKSLQTDLGSTLLPTAYCLYKIKHTLLICSFVLCYEKIWDNFLVVAIVSVFLKLFLIVSTVTCKWITELTSTTNNSGKSIPVSLLTLCPSRYLWLQLSH